MLVLEIGSSEGFDNEKQEFTKIPGVKVELEHSLVSVSKWESEWEKPFLDRNERTTEETISYIKAMIMSPEVSPEVIDKISDHELALVNIYISAKMTATWFNEPPGSQSTSREIITSELIYYWMIALTIPFECQHWHLNRLLTLIRVCNLKNQPKKKMNRQEAAAQQRQLNAQRRAQYGTTG